jgi:hypothetical protein
MLRHLSSFLESMVGNRSPRIREDSPARLLIQCGRMVSDFDRETGQIFQNSKLVGSISMTEQVEIRQLLRGSGPSPVWVVLVRLLNGREIEVGRMFDEEDASILAAHIGTAIGRPVCVKREVRQVLK